MADPWIDPRVAARRHPALGAKICRTFYRKLPLRWKFAAATLAVDFPKAMRIRLNSIDAIRGFCLINIFVNHMTVGVLTKASPSNLGFSDSAEIFVFLAGVSTYLAYGKLNFAAAWAALWKRAGKLYTYNLAIIGASLLGLLVLAHLVGAQGMLDRLFLNTLKRETPATMAWHVLTLRQSVGYSMVLRLYIALMLMAPLLLWLASKRWWWALPPAALIWAVAGQFGLVAQDSLTHARLTMTILPWTLVFTCGLALGAGLSQGVRMPRSPFLAGAAVAMVLSYMVLLYVLPFWPQGRDWAATRELHFWLGSSKAYESPLRLLHALSLVYLFTAFPNAPVLRLIHQVKRDAFLARLGRRSLEVFTFGAVHALLANEVLNIIERYRGIGSAPAIGFEVAVVVLGLAVMGLIADQRWPFLATGDRPGASAPERSNPGRRGVESLA
jgi:hypothetical protein